MNALLYKSSCLLAALLLAPAPAFSAAALVNTSFEQDGVPPGAELNKLTATIDTTRAHSGTASLRLDKKTKVSAGTFSIPLDAQPVLDANCEFSAWIYTQSGSNVTLSLTANVDDGNRFNLASARGEIEPGKWCRISGTMFAGDWSNRHQEHKLIIGTRDTCWIDDVTFRPGLPETPAQVWPRLKDVLHAAADRRVSSLRPGDTLVLESRHAALAPDTARAEVSFPSASPAIIPADGLLVFAIDATDDLDLTGSLLLLPDADLRPGLRVTVLCDDTVIAAPGVKAASWKAVPTTIPGIPFAAPADIRGKHPPSTVPLVPFRVTKGRHHIAIAGPHIRPGGSFARLELRAAARPAEKPLYAFAVFSDTHLGNGRGGRGNAKLMARSGNELETALRQFKNENGAFAIIAGDLTDNGLRSQFDDVASVVKRAGLPVYACVGNHDSARENSRASIAAAIPELFPSGPQNTDYVFSRPPLRFIMLDGAYWRGKDASIHGHRVAQTDQYSYRAGMLDWLRDTLAADTVTPTIVFSHFQFYLRRGVSDVTGYNFGKQPSQDKNLIAALDAAPNVVATVNGHHHYNVVSNHNGITCIQNPAFVAWPNAYRVCRVYADRIEWEVRQTPNRGLIRESIKPEAALLYTLSTFEGDLAGTVSLAPRPSAQPFPKIP